MSNHPLDNDPGLAIRSGTGYLPAELSYPTWANPTVIEFAEEWQTIRDCIKGQRQIKAKGELYLPKLSGDMDSTDYNRFIDRAVFFNMTGRTVSALTGIIFNRSPNVENIPKKYKSIFKNPTRNNVSFNAFLKKVCRELISMGRYGVLLEMGAADDSNNIPYFVGFSSENILDWSEVTRNGRLVVSEVVLREIKEVKGKFGEDRKYNAIIRRLVLEYDETYNKEVYRQYIYVSDHRHVDVSRTQPKVITPTRQGVPLTEIPFRFLGAIDNTPQIDRSPIADISDLNISHYNSYAQLEHARYYTAMPVFYAQVPSGTSERTYQVGASVVWECAPGEKPGILEMNGHGLNGLTAACDQKEDQISALGGRLMSNQTRSTAESDNALRLKEGNERSILLNIIFSVSEGMSDLVKLFFWWAGASLDEIEDIEVSLNKEFLTDKLGARELRAVYAMYVDGVVPVTVMHHYLQKAEVIPDWMEIEQFKELLAKEDEFLNQPDVHARMRGFATAKDEVDKELAEEELEISRFSEDKKTEVDSQKKSSSTDDLEEDLDD